jgi:hypothetical protein
MLFPSNVSLNSVRFWALDSMQHLSAELM